MCWFLEGDNIHTESLVGMVKKLAEEVKVIDVFLWSFTQRHVDATNFKAQIRLINVEECRE